MLKRGVYAASLSVLNKDLTLNVEATISHGENLIKNGVIINRPPRDGRMAFVRSPDNISIELLQEGHALPPQEPWVSMPNSGVW